MWKMLVGAACLAASATFAEPDSSAHARIVLDNARVRVIRADSVRVVADHPAAVVVVLKYDATHKAGDAYWSGDRAKRQTGKRGDVLSLIIVEPKEGASPPAAPMPDAGTKLGQVPFVGISSTQLVENERVAVIRGRMDVGAQEGFHTHAADIVLVHLSGGVVEDTADGKTKVNRWKHGDVEFEARGSSHSARNMGPAIDAVLVTLKP